MGKRNMGSLKSPSARAQYQAVEHQHRMFAPRHLLLCWNQKLLAEIPPCISPASKKKTVRWKKSHFLFPHTARHHEKVPYLYVTFTAVPGSSLSQIKATLFGDFSTCWSKQFTVKKPQRFKQSLIIRKVLCKLSLVKCNSKQVEDETSGFSLLGTH